MFNGLLFAPDVQEAASSSLGIMADSYNTFAPLINLILGVLFAFVILGGLILLFKK